jgi:hypothetical protein
MITFLYYGVIFSVLLCFLALSGLVMWTFSFRNKEGRAHPRGNWKKGVVYAFGVGMLPWEKESARQHLPTYIAGILYHLGIFAGLLLLFCSLLEFVMSGLPLRG